MKQQIIILVFLTVSSFSGDDYNSFFFEKNRLPILLKQDKQKISDCEFIQDPCGEYINKKYLKIEIPLFRYFLIQGGYIFPTKDEFSKISKKYFPRTLPKPISRSNEKRDSSLATDWKGNDYYYDPIDSGVDIIVLRDERFITLPFTIGYFLDEKNHILKTNASNFLVSLNKYLFNNNHKELENLIKNHYTFFKESYLNEKIFTHLEYKNKLFFLKLIKKYKKDEFEYSIIHINTPTYKSLYSFCKATGIKESEIRKLNPWINKKATNIPPNAEIIIPNLKKEENNESK